MSAPSQAPFDAFFDATRRALGRQGPVRFYGVLGTVTSEAAAPSVALNGSGDLLFESAGRLVQREVSGMYSPEASWKAAAAGFVTRAQSFGDFGPTAMDALGALVSQASAPDTSTRHEPSVDATVQLDPARVPAQFALLKAALTASPSTFNTPIKGTGIKPIDLILAALSSEDKKVQNEGLGMAAFVFEKLCDPPSPGEAPVVGPEDHARLVASAIGSAATVSLKEDPLATSARRALDALAHSLVPEMPRNRRTPLHTLLDLVPQR